MVETNNPLEKPDINKLLQNQSEEIYLKSQVRKYILLSLFLPPVGLFLAFRQHFLHLVLPAFLIVESITFGLTNILTILGTKPTLELLNLDTTHLFTGVYWSFLVFSLVVFIIFGILVGFYFKNKVKVTGYLPNHGAAVLLGLVAVHYALGFILLVYLNNQIISSLGDLNSTLENLNQTRDFLQGN